MNQEIDLTQVAAAHSGSIDAQALGVRRPGAQAQESRRPGEVENDLEIGERDRGDLAVLDAAPDLGPIPVVLDSQLQPGGDDRSDRARAPTVPAPLSERGEREAVTPASSAQAAER